MPRFAYACCQRAGPCRRLLSGRESEQRYARQYPERGWRHQGGTGPVQKGLPYGLYAGYALSKDWAVEAGYRGEAGAATFKLPQNYQMKMHTNAAYLAARGNWALNEDWTLFGKIGIARGEAKAEISGKNSPPAESSAAPAPTSVWVAAYQVAKGVALDVQLEHTDKLKRDGLVANMDRIALGVKLDF
jgi:OOP family OmpA-OmpF porin